MIGQDILTAINAYLRGTATLQELAEAADAYQWSEDDANADLKAELMRLAMEGTRELAAGRRHDHEVKRALAHVVLRLGQRYPDNPAGGGLEQ